MKLLDIPLLLQQPGSIDCGPTCVQMVLHYFDIQKDFKELQNKLQYDAVGTSIFDNGALLLDEGLKTTVITAQPLLFPPDITHTLHSSDDIRTLIQKKLQNGHEQTDILQTFDTYLEKRGNVVIEIPSFSHITKAIDEDKPVIAGMYAQALGSNEGKFHFVVVSGYREDEVYITNPWPPSVHQGWFPYEQFIYGVYASTCVAIDNGSFLIVER